MAIRLKSVASSVGLIPVTLQGLSSSIRGTFDVAPARTGVLHASLANLTATITGLFSQSMIRTGTMHSTLAGITANLDGTVVNIDTIAPNNVVITVSATESAFAVSWTPSADYQSGLHPTQPYICEKSLDGGSTWLSLYSGTGRAIGETGFSLGVTRHYRVQAQDAAGNRSAWSAASAMTQAGGTVYFSTGWESGDNFDYGGGAASISIVQSGVAIPVEGANCARYALTNGTGNNVFRTKNTFATPGNLSSMPRSAWLQLAFSQDTVTTWPGAAHKIAQLEYFYSSDPAFSNAYRRYQVILAVDSSGRYYVELTKITGDPANPTYNTNAIAQTSTSFGPNDTNANWDNLRLQVIPDTTGSPSNPWTTASNGTIKLWRNGQLIIDRANVNITDGRSDAGIGILIVGAQTGGTWVGNHYRYYDRIVLASDSSLLPAMPTSPVNRIPSANLVFDATYASTTSMGGDSSQPNDNGDSYGTQWLSQILTTGGPTGQRAYQYWLLPQQEGQHAWGHYISSLPASSVYFVRVRLRVDAPDAGKTNFSGVGQPGNTLNSRSRNKWLWWPGTGSARWILNVDGRLQDEEDSVDLTGVQHTYTAGQWNFEMQQDGGGTMRTWGYTTGVWYDVQVEVNHGASPRVKLWVDDMTYASPLINYPGSVPSPSNQFLLGGYSNSGLMPNGQFRITHADLEVGTTFNANW